MHSKKASSTSQTRNSRDSRQLSRWRCLFGGLSETNLYYSGIKASNLPQDQNFQDLDGESISNYLVELLGASVDIIHPDLNSIHSIFDSNKVKAREGLCDFAMQLLDLKCNLLSKSIDETIKVNPNFIRPIIAIMNNTGVNGVIEIKKALDKSYGSHWLCFVLLPKNFKGFLDLLKTPSKVEQILLYDSLSNSTFSRLPTGFKNLFTQENIFKRRLDTGFKEYKIPPLASSVQKVTLNSTKQQLQNSCGYWAIHNGIMTVLTGSDWF